MITINDLYLAHHGIKGQKWGVRRYQNSDGSLTNKGLKRYYGSDAKHRPDGPTSKGTSSTGSSSKSSETLQKAGRFLSDHKREIAIGAAVAGGALAAYGLHEAYDAGLQGQTWTREGRYAQEFADYSKKFGDKTIKKGTVISTLSMDPDRTKDTDVFFATYKPEDVDRYMHRFNKVNLKDIGHGLHTKLSIGNRLIEDCDFAGEQSGTDIMSKLMDSDDDFRGFIMDPSRMAAHPYAGKRHERWKGFREANRTLEELQRTGKKPTPEQARHLYRLFNYAMPLSDSNMDPKMAEDVTRQRKKFTDALIKAGYAGVLDINDSLYGGMRANAPIIVLDQNKLVPDHVKQTKVRDIVSASVRDAARSVSGKYAQA